MQKDFQTLPFWAKACKLAGLTPQSSDGKKPVSILALFSANLGRGGRMVPLETGSGLF
jgi:hypothetical protein